MIKVDGGILLCLLLVSCSSDNEFSFSENQVRMCCQAAMVTENTSDEQNGTITKGWDPSLGNQYPYDYVYVISDADDEKYEPGKIKVVKMPIMQNPGLSSVDMCFQYDPGTNPKDPEDDVFITVDGKKIEVEDCMFSSIKTGSAKMDKSKSITTPHGTYAYEPYGDKLFFSDFFEAEYKIKKGKKGYIELEVKTPSGGKEKVTISADKPLTIPLKRYTSVVKGQMVITNLPKKSKKNKNGKYTLSVTDFESKFGALTDWEVRTFMDNAPVQFTYANMAKSPSGSSVIALSENLLPLTQQSHAGFTVDGNSASCTGVGMLDTSMPHIFPMSTSKSHICYSFYYKGNKKIGKLPILPSTTIKVPINDVKIMANEEWTITTVLDQVDFEKGVTGQYDVSRASANDPIFGHVVNIPYHKVATRK